MKQLNKYKLDIIALQETHIKESGISQIENYFLLNSGSEITRFGVGFLISMEMKVRLRNLHRCLTDYVTWNLKKEEEWHC